MTSEQWRPTASMMALKERAGLLKRLRHYFDGCDVMEVETPMLSKKAAVDVHIESFTTEFNPIGVNTKESCYLHTSPEFAMKRLLAAGIGDIYSLGRVFRNGEAGGRHNPEFTMLEWYRIGMDQQSLMDDVTALIKSVCEFTEVRRVSYHAIFKEYLGVDLSTASDFDLNQIVQKKIDGSLSGLERNDCLDLLFSRFIEPHLGSSDPYSLEGVFVYDYPATMSALARLRTGEQGDPVAARFELFINGVEIANGYHELLNAQEQEVRFEAESQKRSERDLKLYPYDQRLVQALEHGLPDCAGVALGVDRLLMLMLKVDRISDVLAFDFGQA